MLEKSLDRPAVTSLVDYQGFCGFSSAPKGQASSSPPGSLPTQEAGEGVSGVGAAAGEAEAGEEGFQRVSPQEVVQRIGGGWAPYVLDVRWELAPRGLQAQEEASCGVAR